MSSKLNNCLENRVLLKKPAATAMLNWIVVLAGLAITAWACRESTKQTKHRPIYGVLAFILIMTTTGALISTAGAEELMSTDTSNTFRLVMFVAVALGFISRG